jgi:YidC/Oxa1 family membrane protein insertase
MFSFFSEYTTAQKIIARHYHVIFYAENGYYFQYFEHLYEELIKIENMRVCYLTSDKKDPVLADNRVEAYYIKNTLAGIFARLQADVMIMTMPDLHNFIFKKSASVKKYIYVFHALVSTHQQYRAHAFDHYDAIFCTGPQQIKETRESEQIYSLPQKQVIHYGYPLLETLKQKAKKIGTQQNKILIAPSWYAEGILNTCIFPLVEAVSKTDYKVWIRPHPEFMKRNKKGYEQLVKLARKSNSIFFDTSPSIFTHLPDAAHLITDRSGIAFEYAFATQRPVLFIDTPLKVQNTEMEKFNAVPLENSYRSCIGKSLNPGEVLVVATALAELNNSVERWQSSIKKTEEEVVFSPQGCKDGIQYIRNQLTL